MNLGLLGHPARTSHGVDQLAGTIRKGGGKDTFTLIVSVPTDAGHPGMVAERAITP